MVLCIVLCCCCCCCCCFLCKHGLCITNIGFNHFYTTGYLHQVRSFGRGISYSIQFAPSLAFDSQDCKDDDSKVKKKRKDKKAAKAAKEAESQNEITKLALSDVEFIWTYKDGSRVCKITFTTLCLTTHRMLVLCWS